MRLPALLLVLIAPLFASGTAHAVLIDFEGFAPPGGLVNINPGSAFVDGQFTITVTDGQSAVFDSAAGSQMIGNSTDWFGFAESNTPSLVLTSPLGVFELSSVLVGPSTIASVADISVTITGTTADGGNLVSNQTGLTTATQVNLDWTNLVRVEFTTSDDAGLDDIVVSQFIPPIPTLSTWALVLLASVLLLVAAQRIRRLRNS